MTFISAHCVRTLSRSSRPIAGIISGKTLSYQCSAKRTEMPEGNPVRQPCNTVQYDSVKPAVLNVSWRTIVVIIIVSCIIFFCQMK